MKVLIVGAGAVGQVYAYHLSLGGADVSLFVRPQYAEVSSADLILYPLNGGRFPKPVRFCASQVLSTAAQVAAEIWDVVMLCIPTTGVRDCNFLDLLRATGDALIVSMIPGVDTQHNALHSVAPERIVIGMVTLISYHTPLPGERRPLPGTAFWHPPGAPTLLCGNPARTRDLAAAFRAGGMSVKRRADFQPALMGYSEALMLVFVAVLKKANWKYRAFFAKENVKLFTAARNQALAVVARRLGRPKPWLFSLVGGLFFRMLAFSTRALVPLDLETYLGVHFTKVGAQMRDGLAQLAAEAQSYGLPGDTLRALGAAPR